MTIEAPITNPHVKFQKSEWRIQYGGWICKILLDWGENWYSGVFEVADYESSLKILEFKMVDLIWRIEMSAFSWFGWKLVLGGRRGRWWRIFFQNFEIQNGGSITAGQYAKICSTRIKIGILVKLSWWHQYGGRINEIWYIKYSSVIKLITIAR